MESRSARLILHDPHSRIEMTTGLPARSQHVETVESAKSLQQFIPQCNFLLGSGSSALGGSGSHLTPSGAEYHLIDVGLRGWRPRGVRALFGSPVGFRLPARFISGFIEVSFSCTCCISRLISSSRRSPTAGSSPPESFPSFSRRR
jgi:hypothetical protein